MRLKVVLAILLAAGMLAVAGCLSNNSHPQSAAAPSPVAKVSSNPAPVAPAPKPVAAVSTAPTIPANGGTNAIALQKAEHREYVKKRADELMGLAMQNSPAAHQQIVAELKNPDSAIRKAALEALEQANDRSVVPAMQQIADETDDPDYKKAIQDAIDFINLPSLTEFLAQQKAKKAAAGNQSSQPSRPSSPPLQQTNAQTGR